MKLKTYFKSAIALAVLFGSTALFAQGEQAAVPVFSADGSLLTEEFDKGLPPEWTFATDGGNRKDAAVQNGVLVFAPGAGDNNISLPSLPIDTAQKFVVEITFEFTEAIRNEYSLITLNRQGGYFTVFVTMAGDSMRVMMGKKNMGNIQTGKTYTFALLCEPDGTYQGVLTGADIENPRVQSYTDADGPITNITLGNTRGAGDGSLRLDSVKVGKPVQ